VAAVTSSCLQIVSKHGVDIIVVLGSAGYIGKKVCESLEYRGLSVVGVDLGETFPSLIEGKRALGVNFPS
jgi:nucleoside-diphosphate-sugar epimerase